MLIYQSNQQIVLLKTWNLELCFGINVGTDQAKVEKNLISQAIWLEFLHSPVSSTQYEANNSNLQRKERPIG